MLNWVSGVGELPLTGVAAAIANVVYHATGKRIRDLPITPDKLLALPGKWCGLSVGHRVTPSAAGSAPYWPTSISSLSFEVHAPRRKRIRWILSKGGNSMSKKPPQWVNGLSSHRCSRGGSSFRRNRCRAPRRTAPARWTTTQRSATRGWPASPPPLPV